MPVLRCIPYDTIVILKNNLILGRDKQCTHRIKDESISRKHAYIKCFSNEWFIIDLQSTNGIFINGKKILPYKSISLKYGDMISLTLKFVFIFENKKSFFKYSLKQKLNVLNDHNYSVISNLKSFKKKLDYDKKEYKKKNNLEELQINYNKSKLKSRFLSLENKDRFLDSQLKDLNSKTNHIRLLEYIFKELTCTICHNLFVNPVNFECTHTFCLKCIDNYKKKLDQCPICKVKIKSQNEQLVLKNFIESFVNNFLTDL